MLWNYIWATILSEQLYIPSTQFDILSTYKSHRAPVGHTHPWGEVGFRFKVLPKVLVPFEVAQVSLQGESSQEEVGLFSLDALREQHLLPQVPVVVVPGYPVAAGDRKSRVVKIAALLL